MKITTNTIARLLDDINWANECNSRFVKTLFSGMNVYRNQEFEPVVKILLCPMKNGAGMKFIVADLFSEYAAYFNSEECMTILTEIMVDTPFSALPIDGVVHLTCPIWATNVEDLKNYFCEVCEEALCLVDTIYAAFCQIAERTETIH